jgi:hypothetical protein
MSFCGVAMEMDMGEGAMLLRGPGDGCPDCDDPGDGMNWDRCYAFLNIFVEKFSQNFCVLCSNCC